jgi:hypothetical protein
MTHWGVATGVYTPETQALWIEHIEVIAPILSTGKQVRQNSKDLEAAQQLAARSVQLALTGQAIFAEVPVGSQSARAMTGYAICVGILGTMRSQGLPFYEVTYQEVKRVTGNAAAKKKDMIAWAMAKHPEAPWPTYRRNGTVLVSEGTAEHQADAIAAIYAGIASNQFQQTLRLSAS